jgi:protein TonB
MAPPPPEREEQKSDPVRKAIRRPIDTATPDPTPTAPDNPFDQIGQGIEVAINYPPPDLGTGTVTRPVDPSLPVFVKARPDPRYAGAFHPNYPPSLVRDGLEGDVSVRVTIDPRGRVIAVEMVRATNAVFFEETKRQALKSWRFVPATRDGTAVESVQTMTVHFRLEE